MRGIELQWDEISDSKEYYSSRPKPIMSVLIYLILTIVAIAIIYSFIGKIEIVSKGSGVVRPNEKISVVSGMVGGKISSLSYQDGQLINAGEHLIILENTLGLNIERIDNEINKLTFEIEMAEKYIESLKVQENKFSDKLDSDEYEYFIRFTAMQNRAKAISNDSLAESNRLDLSKDGLETTINELRFEVGMLTLLKQSMEQGKDLLKNNQKYQNIYRQYLMNLDMLRRDFDQTIDTLTQNDIRNDLSINLQNLISNLSDHKLLSKSVEEGQNHFPNGNPFSANYNEYKALLEQYSLTISRAENSYNSLVQNGYDLSNALSSAVNAAQTADDSYYNFKTMTITKLNDDIAVLVLDPLVKAELLADYQSFLASIENDTIYVPKTDSLILLRNELLRLSQIIIAAKSDITALQSLIKTNNTDLEDMKLQVASAKEVRNAYIAKTKAQIASSISLLEEKIFAAESELNRANLASNKKDNISDDFTLSIDKLLLDNKVNIESQLTNKKQELDNLENTLMTVYNALDLEQMNTLENGDTLSFSSLWLNALIDSYSNLSFMKSNLDDLNLQRYGLKEQYDLHTISAQMDGVINVITELNSGDILMPNTPIATILPLGESEHRVLLYIDSKDIVGVESGSKVKFEIPALPSQIYGNISGEVISVSRDTKSINNQQTGHYLVECLIDNRKLFDKSGKEANIEVGLALQGRIIVREIRIIDFILQQAFDWVVK